MTKIEEICKMMDEAGTQDIGFMFHRNKPTFQKGYITYEILAILRDDDGGLTIEANSISSWGLRELRVDDSWNARTLDKISRIVEKELSWRFE